MTSALSDQDVLVERAEPGIATAAESSGDRQVLVDASGLARSYRAGSRMVPALRAATCRVYERDRIALVGPSGSGKSTLLHLMGGLEAPTAGRLIWPALGSRGELRPGKVAIVFQAPSLLPALNVVENVELPLLLGRIPAPRARAEAMRALARLELASLAEKLPEELSGGQAQRVSVARALVGSPALILADEPTGQLDHPTAEHLFDVLLSVLDDSRAALVVATHDLAVARRMQTRWRIEHGVLEAGA